jgi:hypothetical protein
MSDKPAIPATVENIPSVAGGISAIASANAPFIYFEGAPFYGLLNGVGKIAIATTRQIAADTNGTVQIDQVIVAHLIGNIPALRALKLALDGVLLMAERPEGPGN